MKTRYSIIVCAVLVAVSAVKAQNFADNFAKKSINQVPSKWSIIAKDAKVTLVDEKKTFSLQDNAIVTPRVNGTSTKYLGDEFTIEFDLFFDEAATAYSQFYKLRLCEGKRDFPISGKVNVNY